MTSDVEKAFGHYVNIDVTSKGGFMKISVEKNVVEFVPESDQETTELERLWNTMVDCVKFNKKLTPIGEFVPQKSNMARFTIEEA
jgi:uncharacterized protein YifE (UPF0438 family)